MNSCFLKVRCSRNNLRQGSNILDILPYTTSLSVPEKKSKRSKPVPEVTKSSIKHNEQNLDKFIVSNREKEAEEGYGVDVVMNEDGTMYAVSD